MGARRLARDRVLAADGQDAGGVPRRVVRLGRPDPSRWRRLLHLLRPRRRFVEGRRQMARTAGGRGLLASASAREGSGRSGDRRCKWFDETARVRRSNRKTSGTCRRATRVCAGALGAIQGTARGQISGRASTNPSWQSRPWKAAWCVISLSSASRRLVVWTGGRAVETAGLENRYARKGIEGSNPSLSVPRVIAPPGAARVAGRGRKTAEDGGRRRGAGLMRGHA